MVQRRRRVFFLTVVLAVSLLALALTRAYRPGTQESTAIGKQNTASPAAVESQKPRTYDRNFKGDLLDALETPPELLVLGGSRAQRFEPSYIRRLTGLSAFNFALQNSRPEDAYAISSYLFSKAPDVDLHCLYAVQATTFIDRPLHAGLLNDERFSRWFPAALVEKEREIVGMPKKGGVTSGNRYSDRGCLLHNSYDERVERGVSLEAILDAYITRLLPNVASTNPSRARSRLYFRKVLELYNEHGMTPAIVVMPYHPVALEAFREAGWQAKHDWLLDYLTGLQQTYDFRILDYTEIESFGGDADYFYDGSHVTKENARLILKQAVHDAPKCF